MKRKRRLFTGNELQVLDNNVAEYKEKLGERFIKSYLSSNNPSYTIVVEYWETK